MEKANVERKLLDCHSCLWHHTPELFKKCSVDIVSIMQNAQPAAFLRSFDLEQLKERLYWLLRIPATWTKSFRLPLTLLKVKVSKGWRHHKSMDESGFLELFLTCLLVSAWRINHSVTGTDWGHCNVYVGNGKNYLLQLERGVGSAMHEWLRELPYSSLDEMRCFSIFHE